MAAKPVPDDIQQAARAAFNFLSKFSHPSQAGSRWPLAVGRKVVANFGDRGFPAPGSSEALQWLQVNIRNRSGVSVSVKGLQFTRHFCVSTHADNLKHSHAKALAARAMGVVHAGTSISLVWRLVNEIDLRRAEEVGRMAIDVLGGRYHDDFLFPLPGSVRCGNTIVVEKRMDPALISRPTQFMLAAQRPSAPAGDQRSLDLVNALRGFGIEAQPAEARRGPRVTLHEIVPGHGVRAGRIVELASDGSLAMALGVESVRVDTATGRNTIGVEVPHEKPEKVLLPELLASDAFRQSNAVLPLALGKGIEGAPVVADLKKMPHLLLAGTTGSGKSVALKGMILSLLSRLSTAEIGFIMIDPKHLDLTPFEGIPHLALPIITDPDHAIQALGRVIEEMEARYSFMRRRGVDGVAEYNELVRADERFPYLVVVIDELADLMMQAGKELDASVRRLSGKARAAGIHLIVATQHPSVDVITGTIKANFSARIGMRVTTAVNSRVIFGDTSRAGAEQLLGEGDMLYMAEGARLRRIQGPFVSNREVREMVKRYRGQPAPANRGQAFDGPLLPCRPKLLPTYRAEDECRGEVGSARERVARALNAGGLPTSILLARANVGRATLNRLADDGFVVRRPSRLSRETLWTLAA